MADSDDNFEVLLTVFYNEKEVDSRPYKQKPTEDDIVNHSIQVLARKQPVDPNTVWNHRITKWTNKFGGRFVDIDDVSDIENGDQVGVYSEEVNLVCKF